MVRTVLSPREVQVLELMARGYQHKEIAASLGVEYSTVKRYVYFIMNKLECRSRVSVVIKALQLDIIEYPGQSEYR